MLYRPTVPERPDQQGEEERHHPQQRRRNPPTQSTDAASHAAATTAAPGAGQAAHHSGSAAPGPYHSGESNSPGAHAQARAQIIIKQSTKVWFGLWEGAQPICR